MDKRCNQIYSSTQKRIIMKKFSRNCLVDINHTLADIYSGISCYIKIFWSSTGPWQYHHPLFNVGEIKAQSILFRMAHRVKTRCLTSLPVCPSIHYTLLMIQSVSAAKCARENDTNGLYRHQGEQTMICSLDWSFLLPSPQFTENQGWKKIFLLLLIEL